MTDPDRRTLERTTYDAGPRAARALFDVGSGARPAPRPPRRRPRPPPPPRGPPSAYTADSFCATLRSGIDPAHVTLKAAMPRYDATDAQCADLWAFLIPIPTSR